LSSGPSATDDTFGSGLQRGDQQQYGQRGSGNDDNY
jgi:hypothetical protein